jgi:hypothetical protein
VYRELNLKIFRVSPAVDNPVNKHVSVDVIHPRRWGLFASSRQCIVVLTFPTTEDADRFRADPTAAIHIEGKP